MLTRKCPKCEKELTYSNKNKLKRAEKDCSLCKSCAHKGLSKGKGKKQSEEHKRKIAEAVSKYRKGKSLVDLYGEEKAAEIIEKRSSKRRGVKRPPFSDEWKENMSKSRKESEVYKAWMNSEEYKNKRRAINAMRYYGMTLEEWYGMAEEKQLYYLKVKSITRSQDLKSLPNYEKRGHSRNDGYHLDHIYPISLGYINNVAPEVIGHISNLQYIPWKENILKSNKIITDQPPSTE